METTAKIVPSGPNAEQIRYWNETAGPKWVRFEALLDAQIAGLGRRAMERAALVAGDCVLDVGCGCGHTTLELGRLIEPGGRVIGVDVSTVMVERARVRAREGGATNVRFENVDAQTHAFEPAAFDVVFSRFGVMFFTDPLAGFANLRSALRPGGRLALVCWQALPRNPWMFLPLGAAALHITLPPPPAPGAPGPFSLADAERVRAILGRAGFDDVGLEPMEETVTVGAGGSLEQAADFLLEMGPTGAALREADPAVRPAVAASVREVLTPFVTADGVRMPAAAWIVTGRRPPAG